VEEDAASLVQGHKALNRVIVSKRKRWLKALRSLSFLNTIKEVYDFVKALRDTRYDMILDFQALLKSGILIALARGRRKIGFGRGLEHMEHSYIFLNERIPAVSMEIHALSRGMMLLNAVGIPAKEVEYKLPVSDHDRKKIHELMKQHGINSVKPLIVINPMAKWETKLWPPERFTELADKIIARYGIKIVFTGSSEDRFLIDRIISDMNYRAANFSGKTTLMELAALYEKAAFVISTDTGPMHLAAAVGTPVIALFGPTAPWRTGPYGPGHQIVRAQLECSPCFKRRCETMDCMSHISVKQVMDAAVSYF
jgi:3-deoxy-D-manno-octulosonic-acid transferase/heptosyltransferase-1